MRNVFIGILPFLVSVNSIVENGVCYKIDNSVRVIEDCPNNTHTHLHTHTHTHSSTHSSTDDNPTGHEANSSTSSTSSTRSSSSDNVSSNSIGMFGGMELASVFFTFVFLF